MAASEFINIEEARPGDKLDVPGRSRPVDVATMRREQIVSGLPMVVLVPVMVAPEARPVPIEVPVGTKVRRIAVSGVDSTVDNTRL